MISHGVNDKGFAMSGEGVVSSSVSTSSVKSRESVRFSDEHVTGTVKIVEDEEKQLSRSLQERHIQMIALAGAIGTGLFLSLGSALATGGPLGALLGYAFVGAVVCAVMFALGEVCIVYTQYSTKISHTHNAI